jgi:hypothetical protein
VKISIGKCGAVPSRHDPRTITYKAVMKVLGDHQKFRAPAPFFDARPAVIRWPMYGNDTYGDCTFAAIARIMFANAFRRKRASFDVTAEDVVKAYLEMNDGRDVGAMPIDALTYMRNVGIKGHKVVAFARVETKNELERKSALQTFSSQYVAAGLPLRLDDDRDHRWELTPMDQRTDRDAPRSMGGHAFPEFGYQRGVEIAVPWTEEVIVEDPWADLYMEERWVFIDNQEDDEALLAVMHEQLAAIKG